MQLVAGLAIVLISLLAWGGQLVSWLAPTTAERLQLTESESNVEPAFFADGRGEAVWDAFTLWTMPVAGVLLMMDHAAWPYFGLIGSGMYLYFGGRGILTRLVMQREGLAIGTPSNVRIGLGFLAVWCLMGMAVAIAAAMTLSGTA